MAVYVTFFLTGILLVSSISKLLSQKDFQRTLFNIDVRRRWITTLGWLVPALEAIISLLLVISATQLIGRMVLLLMLVTFASVISRAIYHKKQTECHCFGSLLPEKLSMLTLLRLLLLIGLTLYLLLTKSDVTTWVPARPLVYQAFTSFGLLAIYALVVTIIKQIKFPVQKG